MKGKSYGYGAYRGRGGGNAVLKAVVVVLAVLLVLAVAGFLLAERYVVYNDEGQARLEIPFLQGKEPPEVTVKPSPSVPSVVVSETPKPSEPPKPAETPEPSAKPAVILPVSLPLSALVDGTARELVTEGGGTAALFDMKPESGRLEWVSEQSLAIQARVSMDDPEYNQAVKTAAEKDGVHRIARISCFKDQELSNVDQTMAIHTASGYRWLDADKNRWLIPADPTVQDYLIALCGELAALGFDEVLLDHAGYPDAGKLNYIKKDETYGAEVFEPVITAFYQRLAEELKETGIQISVVYDPETAVLTGQSAEVMKELGFSVVTRDENGALHW